LQGVLKKELDPHTGKVAVIKLLVQGQMKEIGSSLFSVE